MRTRDRILTACLVLFGIGLAVSSRAQTRLLRFPDVHGDRVAFCYAGDIWTAPATGGTATRLTSHPGIEQFPKFSPDGKWIAFTGQYDGDEQVYVIPAVGGVPRQLTFYPARGPNTPRNGWDNQVMGWTPDGTRILFNTLRDAGGAARRTLYTVPLEGGHETPLPMYTAGAGDYAPDAKRMVYSPLYRDFRTWKRYEGGWAQDLWLVDLATLKSENITHHPRTDRDPMWIGDRIYFASDRDGTLNLYRYDLATKQIEQVTHSTRWDVRWPSTDHASRIVYEQAGELHVLDLGSGEDAKLSIFVPDDGVAMRPAHVLAEKFIESFGLSPAGERAVFTARGDIFSAPIENGPTRNLTNSSNAHDKWGSWSPDGRSIAFISDRSGEDQVWIVDQDGMGEARRLTDGLKGMLYAPEWSPDGKSIAFSDKDGRLYVLTVADRRLREIARETRGLVEDYAWSPGGSFLAFSLSHASGFHSVRIWSSTDGSIHQVTDSLFDSRGPAWDPGGDYLYYLADHDYAPQGSRKEFNYASNRNTGIFALALRKDVKNPFPPKSDEVALGGAAADTGAAAKRGPAGDRGAGPGGAAGARAPRPAAKPIRIDFDGLAGRVTRVPLPAENYRALAANAGNLLYLRAGAMFNGRESYAKPTLAIFSIKDREESVIAEGVGEYALSADGSRLLTVESGKYNLYEAKPKVKEKKTLSTKDLAVDRVPAQEWREIFEEVWRRYRDFFYVKNMNGYDWRALHDQYAGLLPYVAHRWDLTYVMSEMISELNNSHLYLEGGDYEIPERPVCGLPGARFAVDPQANRYRIAKIFRGQNEEEAYRSPLTEVGVDARVGDYVLAIDGRELNGTDDIYERLRNKKDPVTLTLNQRPALAGARRTTYRPIASEAGLIYLDWVLGNRDQVAKLSSGRVGYLHIPDMGPHGIAEFIKWYYPQIRAEGLVVDVRSNGGGNVSQQIIERLRRKLLGLRFGSNRDDAGTYPEVVFTGPMVCLINETSASDGDIFPYMFREAGLGPLIGKRTWGGVVGISGRGPLLDGGQAFVPQSGTASADGRWVIEGHGVDPDIEVDDDPISMAAGHDLQLERGVREVLERMKTHPAKLPARPPDPVKTK
ncbi:MAG TPA: S41 family peptidase [Terriglobales bacterium]|nr:S41 family peptidase [Terriglobales bacterium]